MARLVLDKFGDLTDNFSSPHARRKVLAGVVMTTGMTGELHPGRGGGFQGCQNPVSSGGRHGGHSLSGPSSVLAGPVSAEGPVGEHPCPGVRVVPVGPVSQDAPVCECSVAHVRLRLLPRLGRA